MSLFAREQRNNLLAAVIPRNSEIGGERSVSLRVTPDTAMRHSAVAGCVLTICNLASLDMHGYRSIDGMEQQVPLDPPLIRAPSASVMAPAWRRQVYDAWCRHGTAFGMVASQAAGYPTQIELLPATSVTVRAVQPYKALPDWEWRVDGKVVECYPNGPLWIAPGLHQPIGSPVGVSPIEMALGAIRLGLAAEDFGASWFYGGGQPSAVFGSDQVLDDDVAKEAQLRITRALRRRRGPLVLGAGLKYQPISVAANESQFLETLDKNVATVARFFLIPPEEIGGTAGNSMTYANQESRSLALLVKTYAPWIKHLEETLGIITPKPITPLVDIDGLLRLDAKTRTDLDVQDIRAGIRSREEIRRKRNLNPDVADDQHIVWPPFVSAKEAVDPTSPGGDPVPVVAPGGQP